MKVKFKGVNGVRMRSNGIHFQLGAEYVVDHKVGIYLLDTFGDAFEAAEEPKVEVKITEEAKPKAAPKRKVTPKKVINKED